MSTRMLAVLLVTLAAGCGVSKEEFAAKERDAQQNLKKYQDESGKTAALERKVASLTDQLAAAQQQAAASREQLGQGQQQIEQLKLAAAQLEQEKGALQAKSAQYEQLTSSLQSQIATGQIEISELRGKMTVKLKDKVLFASGSTALGKEGKAALDAVADAFKDLKGKNVVVGGYTDDVPTGTRSGFKDNWDLSAARAVTVVRYLQSKGVSPGMLGAMGYSEYRPLAPNESPQARSQNRRIEISLTAADATPVVEAPKAEAAK
ncbi:MAG TPA: OmpA family protein [Anaeromyxobacteraceae bacterium]